MLVHICCSVDSHYFLQRLRQELPNEKLIGYFYDPNIHPYSEFLMRYQDVKRSCQKLGIELILGEYDYEAWIKGAKGLEDEPEKGKRCQYCFDFRVGKTAQIAQKLGEKSISTTLLMSPKKDFTQLKNSLNKAVTGTNLQIYAVDFRVGGGTNEQFLLAKKDKLYHQNYCGCVFALERQRKSQNQICQELFSDIYARILPSCVEDRLKLYEKVRECEDKNIKFELFRQHFLNYRLLRGLLKFNGKSLHSYFLFYSNFKRKIIKFTLENECKIAKNLRDGVILLSIDELNRLANSNFKDVLSLCKAKFDLEFEVKIRAKLSGQMSLNPIIILDKILAGKYEINATNEIYNDSREILEII
ncbi:MAG: epoxyqueuosine reductase QueH [Campylobacter sp.]|nr:epoxyqueuosine reductase QueH [Campylobacter sp.]